MVLSGFEPKIEITNKLNLVFTEILLLLPAASLLEAFGQRESLSSLESEKLVIKTKIHPNNYVFVKEKGGRTAQTGAIMLVNKVWLPCRWGVSIKIV